MSHATNYGFSAPLFTKLNLERVVATDRNARFDTRTHACKEFLKANSFIRRKSSNYDHVSMEAAKVVSELRFLFKVACPIKNDVMSLLNVPIVKLNHHYLV